MLTLDLPNQGRPTNIVERYDPESDKWVARASLLTRRGAHNACAYGEIILVAGG